MLTVIVGGAHDGGDVALAVLGDDRKTRHGAPLTGDVERRVPTVVCEPRVGSRLQQLLDQLRLLRDHRQVERRLQAKQEIHGYLDVRVKFIWLMINLHE